MRKIFLPVLIMLMIAISGCYNNNSAVKLADVPDVSDNIIAASTPADIVEIPHETARISFIAAGDNVIHPCIYIDAKRRAQSGSRAYNFKPMYEDVSDYIEEFDIAFINQETLMCGDGFKLSGYPFFNSPQELGLDLVELGFDIINIANNHMLDKGEKGLSQTLDFYNSEQMSGALMIGGYKNRKDFDDIRIIEREGVRIAFLSYTYDTNTLRLPSSSELVVPYIVDEDIERQCEIAEKISDITVVSIHWGDENSLTPSKEQRRVANLLCENGADIIIGHHPHVIQPIEFIKTENNEAVCIYSLGNLLSAMERWQNMLGGFFTFEIVKFSDGEVITENIKFVPTAFFYGPSYYNSHLYFLKDYPLEMSQKHGTKMLYGSSATPEDMIKLCQKTFGEYMSLEPYVY